MGLPTALNGDTASIAGPARRDRPIYATRLTIVHPFELAGSLPLGEGDASIGRTAEGSGVLLVAHPTVSRRHAALRWDASAGSHSVVDLGSHNGTWAEGLPVGKLPRYLADQAVLRFGDVIAVYERDEQPVADPPEVSLDAVPGASLAAGRLRAAIAGAGRERAPVLVEGETGVGKERIAAELHRLGGRPGPLVVINCAALSPSVIESQLFGHARGAFTGATLEHPGLFRAAAGGTLFLDELGELPLELQPKLLRAVELGEIVPIGHTQRVHIDVRIVAATNRSLAGDVAAGTFRRDLHARISLLQVRVPPLRARRADLLAWVDRLYRAWCVAHDRGDAPALQLHTDAALLLLRLPWPDNLRGLQRVVHACASQATGRPWTRAELPHLADVAPQAEATPPPGEPGVTPPVRSPTAASPRTRPNREELVGVLTEHGGSIRATAQHYGRDRKQIRRWLELYGITAEARADGDR